eukprot:gene10431-biopygen7416
MLITLLNDGCLLTIGYDRTVANQIPQRWNLPVLFTSACTLSAGLRRLASAAVVRSGGVEQRVLPRLCLPWSRSPPAGAGKDCDAAVPAGVCVQLPDGLQRSHWGPVLLHGDPWNRAVCGIPDLALRDVDGRLVLAAELPRRSADVRSCLRRWGRSNHLWSLWVWIFCVVWWLGQDCIKVGAHAFMYHFDIFGYVSKSQGTTALQKNEPIEERETSDSHTSEQKEGDAPAQV